MREYTEPTSPLPSTKDSLTLNTASPLKEGFEILKGHFWALIGPYLVLGILGACALQGLWDIIFGTAIMMGANVSLLEYKENGKPFGFGRTISVGFSHWWRGFKIKFVTGLFAGLVGLAGFATIMLSSLLMDNHPKTGGVLLTMSIVFTLYACYWFLARCCLAQACMADKGTSSTDCFNRSWDMAKANQPIIKPIFFSLLGIWLGVIALGIILFFINTGLAQDIREGAGIAVVMVSPLYCVVITYQRLVMNLAYQRIRNQGKVAMTTGS
jgi:hypothetical protein